MQVTRQIWIHSSRRHNYYQVNKESGRFHLCQVNGSLSSIISYDSMAEAVEDGWQISDREVYV